MNRFIALLVSVAASLTLATGARGAGTAPEPKMPPPTQAMPGTAFPSKDSTAGPGKARTRVMAEARSPAARRS